MADRRMRIPRKRLALVASSRATPSKLTPRERQVLRLVATGLTDKEICGVRAISTRTMESHRENIMAKLHVRSTAELVRYAIQHGILPP